MINESFEIFWKKLNGICKKIQAHVAVFKFQSVLAVFKFQSVLAVFTSIWKEILKYTCYTK